MAATEKKEYNIEIKKKNSSYWKFRKKCSDVMKNFHISKSTLLNIKNMKLTLIKQT